MAANDRKSREDATSDLRTSINNAYGFLKGMENISSFYSVTFEEMVQKQMDRLTGKNLGGKPEIDRINKMQKDLVAAIQAIKNIPQDRVYSQEENNAQGVNTA